MNRRFAAVLAVLLLLTFLSAPPAKAEGTDAAVWNPADYPLNPLVFTRQQADWRSLGVKKKTSWPVFSAPFDDAFHPSSGKAKVSASEAFDILGTADHGAWLMIEYKISKGVRRIGWARIPNPLNDQDDLFPADARLSRVTRKVSLTDDPYGKRKSVVTLKAGDTVSALGSADGGWAYVQTEVKGKTAWLFMPEDALEQLPAWEISGDGKTLTVLEGVTRMGHLWSSGDPEYPEAFPVLSREERTAPDLYGDLIPESVEHLVLPESLQYIGGEAIVYRRWKSVRLPSLQPGAMAADAFYGSTIDRLVLSAGCGAYSRSAFGYSPIGAFEVEAGNPFFSAKDGVLFSASGKTLISYPEGKTDQHYDVPAGTESIEAYAFSSDSMYIPLVTLSLPVGLKSIGKQAFSGCGKLISLSVPLTVTDLAEDAFQYCISLERLSLPPGLQASYDSRWAVYTDSSVFNGDNWATQKEESASEEEWDWDPEWAGKTPPDGTVLCYFEAYTDTPDGRGSVPWYASADAAAPSGEVPAGQSVTIRQLQNGRALEQSWEDDHEVNRWYATGSLMPCTGNVFFTAENEYLDFRQWIRPAGDSRILGVLLNAEEPAVRLYDSPGGAEVGHTYEGEQAELLERNGDWLNVRTARGIFWIRNADWMEVPQAAAAE